MSIPMLSNVMTSNPMNWLSPSIMHALGWALVHSLWQGIAVAASAAAGMSLCRRASARYVLAVGALVLMLIAPAATFLFYRSFAPAPVIAAHRSVVLTPELRSAVEAATNRSAGISSGSLSPTFLPWMVEAWLLGVALFSLRSAGGFLLLERERRKRSTVVSDRVLEICFIMQDRLGIDRAIDYCECTWLRAPAVIGWLRPVVFLPLTALSGLTEEQLQSVIVHELAHIKRFDPLVNLFQVCVETLLFYHPAVWWLNKRIRAERENCCDDIAVEVCGNAVEYARALAMMAEWRSAPALAMAANRGPLTERVLRILGLTKLRAGIRGMGITASAFCLTAALVAGDALLGMAHPQLAGANFVAHASVTPSTNPEPQSKPSAKPSASAKPSPAAAPRSEPTSSNASSYIDAMESAGLRDLTVDQLIALKTQDVTPEYVRGLQAQGLHPNAENLIAMKIQDVTPEYVKELHAEGLNPDQNQLIALRIQGVDSQYFHALKDAGLQPDVNQLIALKIQGVTGDYIKGVQAQGLHPTADQAIGMKIQGVTPEYVRDIRALGLNPSANDFIGMKVQDVTPEYIKGLQAAGLKLDVNDIISAKVQDLTPEFVEKAHQHGFKDLSLHKLIQLKQLGILESKADI
jgi:beta-lactamase regulating signal transducer with metallopeptidase domain